METLRQLCAAVVLSLALAASASAGIISTGGADEPPPPPPSASMTEDQTGTAQADGTIYPGVAGSEPEAGTAADIALNVLRSVLSLF